MFKLKVFHNDRDVQYWEDRKEIYETCDKALIACYENALDETQSLMANSDLLGWFEINRDFEITEPYMNELLKDVVFFPVAVVYYNHAPWDRDFDCDIEIITGYAIVEIKED